MKKYKIIVQKLILPRHGEFQSSALDNSYSNNENGVFYFVTGASEIAILDLIKNKPIAIDNISDIFNNAIKNYSIPFHKINRLRQDSWRYFADKSEKGEIWHMNYMSGSPFKNTLTDEEKYSIEVIDEKKLLVDLQNITYNNWMNLSEKEKKDKMNFFIKNPVQASDYIFENNFAR